MSNEAQPNQEIELRNEDEGSDIEERMDEVNVGQNVVVVMGEAPESDEDEYVEDNGQEMNQKLDKHTPHGLDSTVIPDETLKYNTLLHHKLREKNELMSRELENLAYDPYICATKELTNINKQLVNCQKSIVQGVSTALRKTSKDLSILENIIDEMSLDANLKIFSTHS